MIRTTPIKASDYQQKEHTQHIYDIPDTYIGSDKKMSRSEWIYDFETNTMNYRPIELPAGIERLFLEIISNAGDNAYTSRACGIDPKCIEISMNSHYICIRNYGNCIPVENNSEGKLVPEMIFGSLLTSSNYDTSVIRMGCGRNGYGAKLVNIFSKEFTVKVGDSIRGKEYEQTWSNNMATKNQAIIKPYKTKSNYVEVCWLLDFARFGYSVDEGYPREAYELFTRFACDFSFSCKLPVRVVVESISFDKTFDLKGLMDFVALYFPDENVLSKAVWFKIWPTETKGQLKEVKGRRGVYESTDPTDVPMLEACLLDTVDEGTVVSYVNGLMTPKGGIHVNAVYDAISKPILSIANPVPKKRESPNPQRSKLTINDLKPHMSMLVNCRIGNPQYDSQTKGTLVAPVFKITLEDVVFTPIQKWYLIERLLATLELKDLKKLSKTDGKKKRHVSFKGEDANEAGGTKSHQCTLFVVEGMSAMNYATELISQLPGGRDYHGAFPLKGKPLNVMNATPMKISENKEFIELKKALGLTEFADYTKDETFKSLRYGNVVILADSDDDGKHIIGLVLNYFHCRFPTLLQRGYLLFLRTPILRTMKGSQTNTFYTFAEYFDWQRKTKDYNSWKHKYFKGLGTSTKAHITEDVKDPRHVTCIYDEDAKSKFELAFNMDFSDERKTWISKWNQSIKIDTRLDVINISSFIDNEFREYSVAHLHRALPRFLDGLKTSQRKALWGAIQKWAGTADKLIQRNPVEEKVERLAAYVASLTRYHHGGVSMEDTIKLMAQDFVGANNMPYFTRDGQFGSRNMGGKDAGAARYIETKPEWWISYVFRKEDLPLLHMEEDDGEKVEPTTLLPIIPMIVINGCTGIGTGHSTFIPNHNPTDVINWFKQKLSGKKNGLQRVAPWFRGFNGKLILMTRKRKDIEKEEIEVEEKEEQNENAYIHKKADSVLSLVTYGNYHSLGGNKYAINELPIGRWINPYYKFLEAEREKDKAERWLQDFRNCSTAEQPYFEISLTNVIQEPTMESLRLIKSYGMGNMVCLSEKNVPIKYNTVIEMLEAFFEQRLPYYEKRRLHQIKTIEEELQKTILRYKFIEYVLTDKLIVFKRKKEDIYAQMKQLELPEEAKDLLKSVNLSHLSAEDLEELQNKINGLIERKQVLERTKETDMWLSDIEEFEKAYNEHY